MEENTEDQQREINILFVCSGNTCRSVMAQELCRKIWEEELSPEDKKNIALNVSSAGLQAVDGTVTAPEVVKLLTEEGWFFPGKKAEQLKGELVEKADFIFTMTFSQKQEVNQRFPGVREKVWQITEYPGVDTVKEIADPIGGALKRYQQTADEIKRTVKKIVEQQLKRREM